MKLKFDSSYQYQLDAIETVVNLFEGQPLNKGIFEETSLKLKSSTSFSEKGVSNQLVISTAQLLQNVQNIQTQNDILNSESLQYVSFQNEEENIITTTFPNFTIEMETGTGKTYTYLRTIYELNKVYGFKKFVIVVPSVAIREGTLKNLEITNDHFQQLYQNVSIDFSVYDSRKTAGLRTFATANNIQILVMNIDSFTKTENIIHQVRESGVKPIEYIQTTQPIVIMDEPQNMETDIRKRAITSLNPLCALRYSATHRRFYNLLYKLDPVQAYDLGLVKQIEVDGITVMNNYSAAFIAFDKIKLRSRKQQQSHKVQLKIYANTDTSVKTKSITCGLGTDLYEESKQREIYNHGFVLTAIDPENEIIEFANGVTLRKGEAQGGLTDEILRFQMERTLKRHFEKALKYERRGIKVLSLFFVDKVANYREYKKDGTAIKGKFAIWFEEMFEQLRKEKKYQHLYQFSAVAAHNGYFSQDKKGKYKDTKGNTSADSDTYQLIMRDKENLLKQSKPLRFIFSHSALREGWDNPNVFQICTLNESKSDLRKRQEIGRGLRLAVDNNGNRVFDKNINILTVIPNETYKDFSTLLQKEIEQESSVSFKGRIKNAKEKIQISFNQPLTLDQNPLFFEIWNKINFSTYYKTDYETETLIKLAAAAISKMPLIKRPVLVAEMATLAFQSEGIVGHVEDQTVKLTKTKTYPIPNIYDFILGQVDITRSTVFQILEQSNRLDDLRINPQLFLENTVNCIKDVLRELMTKNIQYCIAPKEKGFTTQIFENECVEAYITSVYEVVNTSKTLLNYIKINSEREREFVKKCETNEAIKFYFKLPSSFKIDTPVGNYHGDWAVLLQNGNCLIVDTHTTIDWEDRSFVERFRSKCAILHFGLRNIRCQVE